MTISKKSTIFAQSSWNLVKIITSWLDCIAWIWAQLDQNYGFFTYNQMFGFSTFLLLILCVSLCFKIMWALFHSDILKNASVPFIFQGQFLFIFLKKYRRIKKYSWTIFEKDFWTKFFCLIFCAQPSPWWASWASVKCAELSTS